MIGNEICSGCGSTESLKEIRARQPQARACCLERKMVRITREHIRQREQETLDAESAYKLLKSKAEAMATAFQAMEKKLDAARGREMQQLEAIALLAGAGSVSPDELTQLGVGRVTENPNWKPRDNPRERYFFSAMQLDDLVDMTNAAMHKKATVAKFRQLKGHFVAHQRGVTFLLDQIDGMCHKNTLNGADIDRLRDLRDDLKNMTGRNF